jgi:hypothetical protein
MKRTLPTALALAATLTTTSAAGWPRFQKYEECVAYCDNDDSTCQSVFFDTISGDCQYHDCIYGQFPPDRFRAYIKADATEYCAGTSPTGSPNWVDVTRTATGVATATGTSTSASSAATGTSGASGWGVRAGVDGVLAGAGVWVVAGLLG